MAEKLKHPIRIRTNTMATSGVCSNPQRQGYLTATEVQMMQQQANHQYNLGRQHLMNSQTQAAVYSMVGTPQGQGLFDANWFHQDSENSQQRPEYEQSVWGSIRRALGFDDREAE